MAGSSVPTLFPRRRRLCLSRRAGVWFYSLGKTLGFMDEDIRGLSDPQAWGPGKPKGKGKSRGLKGGEPSIGGTGPICVESLYQAGGI